MNLYNPSYLAKKSFQKNTILTAILSAGFLTTLSVSAEELPLIIDDKQEYSITLSEDLESTKLLNRLSTQLIAGIYIEKNNSGKELRTVSLTGKKVDVNISDLSLLGKQDGSSFRTSLRVFQSNEGTVLNLGGKDTDQVNINITGKPQPNENNQIMGLVAWGSSESSKLGGGVINVNSKSLVININPETNVVSYAILAQGSTDKAPDKTAQITLNADSEINVSGESGHGLVAFSYGKVETLGNLRINASEGSVITARGQGQINVNTNATKTVQLDGDVRFSYQKDKSGTKNDGQVSIILSDKDSYWNGSAKHTFHSDEDIEVIHGNLSGSNLFLTLSNGAVWNPTAVKLEENKIGNNWDGIYYNAISALTMNDGVVNVQNNGQPVIVKKLEGNGTINIETTKTDSGISAGKFVVGTAVNELQADKVEGVAVEGAASNSNLTVNFKGITSDEINSEEFKSLAQQVQALGATQTQTVAEGLINGELLQTVGSDGNVVSTQISENSVNQSLRDIGAMTFLGFRTAINDLDKRLGDLRSYSGENGGWVRYLGGQHRYGARNMKLNYNGFQAGFDHRFGEFYAGAALGYTKGNGHLRNGSSDNNNWNFGLYGGWLGEKGQFIDLIVKRHRFKNEFNLHNTSGLLSGGSYHNWATSVSAEAGWRFSCPTTGFYAEPQVELSFGRMESGSFTTSQGVKVKQNGINSTVGRLGVAAGYTLPNSKGNAYVKASVLHDWSAKVKGSMSKASLKQSYRDDLSGTWAEFSVGGTYNATKNISAYGEFQTSTGSPVRSPWAASAGIRYNF